MFSKKNKNGQKTQKEDTNIKNINEIGNIFPIKNDKNSDINDINKNSEYEVWRTIDDKNSKNNLILTEYLKKSENENNNKNNIIKNKIIINNIKEKINIIENFFTEKQQSKNNKNIDDIEEENDSDNSDKETERTISKIRIDEEDDDDIVEDKLFEEKANKVRSKKVINKKIIETENIKEYPEFKAECKFYGEGKERYHVKIIIDSTFNLNFYPELKKGFKSYNYNYYQFPLLSIKNYIVTKKNKKFVIDIILKDYRSFSFKLLSEDYQRFNYIIQEFGKPNTNLQYFHYAYYYYNEYTKKKKDSLGINGWLIYDPILEYKNQEIDIENEFRILDNKNYTYCSTYPKEVIIPSSLSDEDIRKCTEYRTKERFPVLTYRYNKNGKCIWRSSQIKSGIKGKTNMDVILLTTIAKGSKKLFVYDARPLLNAWANKLKGAGFEDTSQYSEINMELIFCGIPNIHVVRKSCHKVYNNIYYKNDNEEKNKLINNNESGNWYDSIILLIKASLQISDTIKSNNTVLIHCSDGWDRTTQLCCLAQIFLEKRYRTLNGFIILIEKDFLSFGHQFRYRCGMYSPSDSPSNISSENQKSPIFIQFLDAVYQIMIQNYNKFEFNTDLLFFLANEIYSGKYGTFLFNNDFERDKYNAKEKTISVWNYVKENEYKFINPIYESKDFSPFVINYKRIHMWNKYFFRFEDGDNLYNEKINKVFKDLNNKIDTKDKIIDELINFINKNCKEDTIDSLSQETKNLIKEKMKNKEKI